MPSPTQLSVLQEILKELKTHSAILLGIETAVRPQTYKLEEQPVTEKTAEVNETPMPSTVTEVESMKEPVSKFPIPAEYKEVVETVLNKEFGIECEPLSDKPAFQFTIVVPDKYSNATVQYREMYGGDRRSRVINYVEGVNGVRDWAVKVLENLGPEKRTAISIAKEQVKV